MHSSPTCTRVKRPEGSQRAWSDRYCMYNKYSGQIDMFNKYSAGLIALVSYCVPPSQKIINQIAQIPHWKVEGRNRSDFRCPQYCCWVRVLMHPTITIRHPLSPPLILTLINVCSRCNVRNRHMSSPHCIALQLFDFSPLCQSRINSQS